MTGKEEGALMESSRNNKWTISLSDAGQMLKLRTIVTYEAGVRGLGLGQACAQLVTEAVDVESYPKDIRQQLDAIDEQSKLHALNRALRMSVEPYKA